MDRIGDDENATLEELLDDLEDMNKQVCEDSDMCEENSDLSVNKESDMKDRIVTLEMKIKRLNKIIREKDEIIKKSKKEIAILRENNSKSINDRKTNTNCELSKKRAKKSPKCKFFERGKCKNTDLSLIHI